MTIGWRLYRIFSTSYCTVPSRFVQFVKVYRACQHLKPLLYKLDSDYSLVYDSLPQNRQTATKCEILGTERNLIRVRNKTLARPAYN